MLCPSCSMTGDAITVFSAIRSPCSGGGEIALAAKGAAYVGGAARPEASRRVGAVVATLSERPLGVKQPFGPRISCADGRPPAHRARLVRAGGWLRRFRLDASVAAPLDARRSASARAGPPPPAEAARDAAPNARLPVLDDRRLPHRDGRAVARCRHRPRPRRDASLLPGGRLRAGEGDRLAAQRLDRPPRPRLRARPRGRSRARPPGRPARPRRRSVALWPLGAAGRVLQRRRLLRGSERAGRLPPGGGAAGDR